MPSRTTLFAWAAPAFASGSPVDHTWITNFDNRAKHYPTIADVVAAHKDYWFCWGSYHANGGTPADPTGALGKQTGDLGLARCLVLSNADSRSVAAARGAIFVYGVDGVCHQLANQVLYATSDSGSPLTVSAARGYFASAFLYGTYGLEHAAWAAKMQVCAVSPPREGISGAPKMPGLKDDFVERAQSVLGAGDQETLAKLLALKAEVHAFVAQKAPGFEPPDAETLNARNQHLIDQAAKLLGPDKFKAVFGFPAETGISLVDPTIARSGGAPRKGR